jgi:hypothetical protein
MSPRDELTHLIGQMDGESRNLVQRLAEGLLADTSGARSGLFTVVHELADQQVNQLLGVARAMALPIEETIDSGSKIITAEFAAEFRARLQAHHATHTTPMDRLSFENAFLAASRAAGRATDEAPSRTTRFFDATVDDERTALKTEGAKSMKADRLHISKLSEAAWIQDMRSGRMRREKTMEFLDEFLEAVDRIFVLRYYQADTAPHYELVEIPMSHFEALKSVPASAFNADAPRIKIEDAGGPIMEFRIDRSDSKITVGKIEKNRCIVHGDWRLTGLASTTEAPSE